MEQIPLLEKAFSFYGLREYEGKKDNPQIIAFFDELGFPGSKLKDETAWCCAFVSYVAKTSGFEYSKSLAARSYMNIGEAIDDPRLGDVVVFWRESPSSWKGHVAFYINEDESYIYCLGGNQNNQVCIRRYPKYRLLGYRRLSKRPSVR